MHPQRIGEELIDALVEVHAADWQAAGLEGFGKPTGYLERQLRRFTGLWEHNATREIAALDEVTRWLGEHIPESGPATIVHGDYRLGNVMFTGDRLSAIFDWELATIGDPLADIGYLLATYAAARRPREHRRLAHHRHAHHARLPDAATRSSPATRTAPGAR